MTKLQRKRKLQRFLDRFFKKESHGRFLIQRHPLLMGKRPVDMLGNDEDFEELMNLLRGIENGDFA